MFPKQTIRTLGLGELEAEEVEEDIAGSGQV